MRRCYYESEKMLERALRVIPLGAQTFSKSKTQYPLGSSPFFIKNGLGSCVWDIDGNKYIDFVNALGAITLGYNDPDVLLAVRRQLDEGTIFSLSNLLEVEVAEKIIEMVPCAEMVRFGKNGSDVTAAAVRLARAYTSRDHVAVCGYHGWQDWYIGTTSRDLGVPESTKKLSHSFIYNNIESLHKIFSDYPGQISAVVLEPMNAVYPKKDFLKEVKELAHKNGAVLVFDEMVTGFRFAQGGAQEFFDVTPDLATFGKGMSNGYPLSVIAGSGKIMKLMEDVFFSFTFGGETLSLAASLATMNKIQKQPVLKHIGNIGQKILNLLQNLITKHKVDNIFSLSGHPSWIFLTIKDCSFYSSFEMKTLFLQEMLVRGILTLGTHNLNYAHSDSDIMLLINVYDEVFPIIKEASETKSLERMLRCKSLKPLFSVR